MWPEMTTPQDQRALVTQIINQGLENLSKVESQRITNAQIEQLRQAKERQDRADHARFLSLVLGLSDEQPRDEAGRYVAKQPTEAEEHSAFLSQVLGVNENE
jgi:hypothetical protein